MRIRFYILFLSISISLFACKKEGEIKQINKALVAFEKIEIVDAFKVNLIEGSAYTAEILGGEDAIGGVELTVRDNVLYIENDRKFKWRTPTTNEVKITVTSLPLKEVTALGGSTIQTINAITSDEFGLILAGKSNEANLEVRGNGFYYWNNFPSGGKLRLSGAVNTLKLWNYALMAVDAKNLITNYALIENNSKGDCEVNVIERLDYSIKGEGNIQLYGVPAEINLNELSSSGQLIQH